MKGTTNVPNSYILLRRANKILFLLREHTGYMDGQYGLPAGHGEDLESFLTTAGREAREEVGITLAAPNLKHVHTMHRLATAGDHVRVDIFFEAYSWEGKPKNAEPDKHAAIAWFDLDELPSNVMDYQRYALEQIKAGKTYSEFGWQPA